MHVGVEWGRKKGTGGRGGWGDGSVSFSSKFLSPSASVLLWVDTDGVTAFPQKRQMKQTVQTCVTLIPAIRGAMSNPGVIHLLFFHGTSQGQ